jgi:hypothetical protein
MCVGHPDLVDRQEEEDGVEEKGYVCVEKQNDHVQCWRCRKREKGSGLMRCVGLCGGEKGPEDLLMLSLGFLPVVLVVLVPEGNATEGNAAGPRS